MLGSVGCRIIEILLQETSRSRALMITPVQTYAAPPPPRAFPHWAAESANAYQINFSNQFSVLSGLHTAF
jgi:hypothetical protein